MSAFSVEETEIVKEDMTVNEFLDVEWNLAEKLSYFKGKVCRWVIRCICRTEKNYYLFCPRCMLIPYTSFGNQWRLVPCTIQALGKRVLVYLATVQNLWDRMGIYAQAIGFVSQGGQFLSLLLSVGISSPFYCWLSKWSTQPQIEKWLKPWTI